MVIIFGPAVWKNIYTVRPEKVLGTCEILLDGEKYMQGTSHAPT